eukprot:CAMPEP_0117492228 /NCGR_PEP_ID=MMETSP0784-20121206/18473_1 /TAXON_ID=39447 /ORGANISM="" /LENGTH=771 /DNA_ID=CAMNT_0005287041 /DNA_START=74 /DNA_END=2390 /DNA_ORIENTATION=+
MKFGSAFHAVAALVAMTTFVSPGAGAAESGRGDRTITQVVKLLQGMLDKSKADGAAERELYAKYKCYCDSNEKEKTASVEDLGTQIGLLGSKIEGLQGANGVLSSESARLSADIASNEKARADAATLRGQEKAAFDAEEADMSAAIDQLKQAIDVLAAIGSDQSLQQSTGEDHTRFMASYTPGATNLVKLRSTMKQALLAANTFLAPAQRAKVESFLQTPFTGTYTSQSSEIIGILKQMRDTFTSNLEEARSAEAAAVVAHGKFIATKTQEHTSMTNAFNQKQALLGTNDGDLATKTRQLTEAQDQKAAAEAFLANLDTMCSAKAKDYEKRNMLRANEEAAIAKAIAILNSDEAFHAFGKVRATSAPSTSFLQLRSVHRHGIVRARGKIVANATFISSAKAQQMLLRCAARSRRVRRVIALLEAGNPFDRVLAEIAKMQALVDAEAVLDSKQLTWCNDARATSGASLDAKKLDISSLGDLINNLVNSIEDPASGLRKQIADTEGDIDTNYNAQKEQTATRRDDHKAYTKNAGDIAEATVLLTKAVAVLRKYYAALEREANQPLLVQAQKQSPPATWDEEYTGQSSTGTDAISMIEFILGETKKEEQAAHETEAADQKAYEGSMETLKSEEGSLQTQLVDLKQLLSEKELELENARVSLDVVTRERVSIERYLEQIKPGCDFITMNYGTREANRADEKSALNNAVTLLKATPQYKAAVAGADLASLGACQALCLGSNRTHVQCKACMAGVSQPGIALVTPAPLAAEEAATWV